MLSVHTTSKEHQENPTARLPIKHWCRVCNVALTTDIEYEEHMGYPWHDYQQRLWDTTPDDLKCVHCTRMFRAYRERETHLATAKHRKNVSKTDSSLPTTANPVS
jgi:hypothetical protein